MKLLSISSSDLSRLPNIKDGNYWIKESESGACEDEWKCYRYTNGVQFSDDVQTSNCKVLCKRTISDISSRQIRKAKLDTKVFNKQCTETQRKKREGMI